MSQSDLIEPWGLSLHLTRPAAATLADWLSWVRLVDADRTAHLALPTMRPGDTMCDFARVASPGTVVWLAMPGEAATFADRMCSRCVCLAICGADPCGGDVRGGPGCSCDPEF